MRFLRTRRGVYGTMSEQKNNVTSRDVAKLAGVSQATVSYVLSGNERQKISEETGSGSSVRRESWAMCPTGRPGAFEADEADASAS